MKVKELRKYLKDRGVKRYSTMKKADLAKKVAEIQEKEAKDEYERQLRERALCRDCLNQQRIQPKIDENTFNQRSLEGLIRTLVCDYCKHEKFICDGDNEICINCGTLQPPSSEVYPISWQSRRL